MIRVLLADDHRLIRIGVRDMLTAAGGIEVVGEAANGNEAVRKLRENPPDVAVIDMNMPGISGIALVRELATNFAQVRLLVLTMHRDSAFVAQALHAGAHGFLSKDTDPEMLAIAVRKVAAGERFVDPTLFHFDPISSPDTFSPDSPALTARELEVLKLFAAGHSVNAIAAQLHLSAKTISTHKIRMMEKLGIDNNAGLIRYAIQRGLGTTQG